MAKIKNNEFSMQDNLVEIKNLCFSHDQRRIFNGVDIAVRRGKITAIMGPSGSGKTTLLRLMSALLRPDSGEVLIDVTAKKLGMTCVVNDHGYLTGVYTDGDVRRTLSRDLDISVTRMEEVMTCNCHTIKQGILAAEALAMMQELKITSLIIVDDDHRPTAVVHLHDLLRAGVF